jgi:hypothetical protein
MKLFMKSTTCSKIWNIPYYLIFTTKFNDSSILIRIISWDYFNLSVANEYIGDVTIPSQFIMYNQCCSRQISQSDCSFHIKLNYIYIYKLWHICLKPGTGFLSPYVMACFGVWWFVVRGDCWSCWYLWYCWPSWFQLSFHNRTN